MVCKKGDKTNATICAIAGLLPMVGDAFVKGGTKAVVKAAGDTGTDSIIKAMDPKSGISKAMILR